jgi:hypothetical protein
MKTYSINEVQTMKTANTFAVLAAIASLATIPAASAEEVTCESANFSTRVMDQFAGVRFSCLEIVERNGGPHAVLKAEVVRVASPNMVLKFARPEGGFTNPITVTPQSGYIFTVEGGREVNLRDLTVSSELRVYVPVTGPVG